MQRYVKRAFSFSCLMLALGACTTTGVVRLDVNSDVPTPLVEQSPLRAGVVYSKQINQFSTKEKPSRGKSWDISLGNTNRKILDDLFNSLFATLVELPDLESAADRSPPLDLTIIPSIDDFSMLTADESGSKFFAVSMRHFLDIYKGDGKLAGRLEINSYGRSKSALLTSGSEEIDSAIDEAFRDFASTLVTQLPGKLHQAGFVAIALEPEPGEIDSEQ